MNGDKLSPGAIIDLTDWAELENADGSAFPVTPAKLHDLTSGDFLKVTSSLSHLYHALLNDGVVYSATAQLSGMSPHSWATAKVEPHSPLHGMGINFHSEASSFHGWPMWPSMSALSTSSAFENGGIFADRAISRFPEHQEYLPGSISGRRLLL
ncbi:hypothetical protein ACFQVA_11920 [Actinomadura keratinilytica]